MKNNIKLTVSLAKLNLGTQVQLNRPYPYFDTYTKHMKRERTGMIRRTNNGVLLREHWRNENRFRFRNWWDKKIKVETVWAFDRWVSNKKSLYNTCRKKVEEETEIEMERWVWRGTTTNKRNRGRRNGQQKLEKTPARSLPLTIAKRPGKVYRQHDMLNFSLTHLTSCYTAQHVDKLSNRLI